MKGEMPNMLKVGVESLVKDSSANFEAAADMKAKTERFTMDVPKAPVANNFVTQIVDESESAQSDKKHEFANGIGGGNGGTQIV